MGTGSRGEKGVRSEWHLKLASSGASGSYVHLDEQGPHLRMSDWNFDVSIPRAQEKKVSGAKLVF